MSGVERGFHRLGVAAAVVVFLLCALLFAIVAKDATEAGRWLLFAIGAGLTLSAYAVCRGIGWVASGFRG